jgi:hypothetical protein
MGKVDNNKQPTLMSFPQPAVTLIGRVHQEWVTFCMPHYQCFVIGTYSKKIASRRRLHENVMHQSWPNDIDQLFPVKITWGHQSWVEGDLDLERGCAIKVSWQHWCLKAHFQNAFHTLQKGDFVCIYFLFTHGYNILFTMNFLYWTSVLNWCIW